MRKSEFATSTPLSGSGLINGIAIIFCCLVKNYDKRLSLFLEIRCKGTAKKIKHRVRDTHDV
jgi:hypothetical protein